MQWFGKLLLNSNQGHVSFKCQHAAPQFGLTQHWIKFNYTYSFLFNQFMKLGWVYQVLSGEDVHWVMDIFLCLERNDEIVISMSEPFTTHNKKPFEFTYNFVDSIWKLRFFDQAWRFSLIAFTCRCSTYRKWKHNGFNSLTLSVVGMAYLSSFLTNPIIKLTSCDVTSIAATDGCFVKGALNVSKTDSNIKENDLAINKIFRSNVHSNTSVCLKSHENSKKHN